MRYRSSFPLVCFNDHPVIGEFCCGRFGWAVRLEPASWRLEKGKPQTAVVVFHTFRMTTYTTPLTPGRLPRLVPWGEEWLLQSRLFFQLSRGICWQGGGNGNPHLPSGQLVAGHQVRSCSVSPKIGRVSCGVTTVILIIAAAEGQGCLTLSLECLKFAPTYK